MPQFPPLTTLPLVRTICGTLCLLALLTGCGGDGWTSDEVEDAVRVTMGERIAELAPDGSLASLDCAKRQGNEFTCLAEVSAPDGSAVLTASVTCEVDCIWALDNYAIQP